MRVSDRKLVIQESLLMTGASYGAYFLRFFSGLLLRSLLGPSFYGYYSILMIVEGYSVYADAGLLRGLEKRLPGLLSTGTPSDVRTITHVALTFICITSTVVVFLGLCATFILQMSEPLKQGLRVLCPIILLKQIADFLLTVARCRKDFPWLAKTSILSSAVGLLAVLLLTHFFGFLGSVVSISFPLVTIVLMLAPRARFSWGFALDLGQAKNLMAAGLPLLFVGFMFLTMLTVDRLMIKQFLGVTSVGHYSIGVMFFNLLFFIPRQVSVVMFPRFLQRYALTGQVESLKSYLLDPTSMLSVLMPVFLGGTYILAPVLIELILPAYSPGIPAMKWLLPGLFCASLTHMPTQLLITLGKERRIIRTQVFCIACSIGFNYFLIKSGHGVVGVALGTSLAYMVYAVMLLFYSLRLVTGTLSITLRFLAAIQLPALWIVLILVTTERCVQTTRISLAGGLLIRLVVLCIVSLPLVLFALKRLKASGD